jgi:tRNA pseudouridine38-40 synthase
MRYFVRCKYNGTDFHGWQSQKNTPDTVQGNIERALHVFLPNNPEIIGCGRTDAGVHASEYYFHFDSIELDVGLIKYKLNSILPFAIVVSEVIIVHDDAHTRYDAHKRAYTYYIVGERDPFRKWTTHRHPQLEKIKLEDLNSAASLLLEYENFETFCKNGSDEKTKKCTMYRSEWVQTTDGYTYHVEANRFLRGMIRLIVGMCLNVARGQITIEEVKYAMDNRLRLKKDWSVPARGLFLSRIEYPYIPNLESNRNNEI